MIGSEVKEVVDALTPLAQAMRTDVQNLFAVMSKYVFAQGVTWTIASAFFALLFLSISIWMLIILMGAVRDNEDNAAFTAFLVGFFSVVALGFSVMGVADNVTKIIAPDGAALIQILEKVSD